MINIHLLVHLGSARKGLTINSASQSAVFCWFRNTGGELYLTEYKPQDGGSGG